MNVVENRLRDNDCVDAHPRFSDRDILKALSKHSQSGSAPFDESPFQDGSLRTRNTSNSTVTPSNSGSDPTTSVASASTASATA